MAKSKIIWSHTAQIRLFEILNYYSERNKSKTFSLKLHKRFITALGLLNKHPDLGKRTEIENIRGIVVGDYILFYEKTTENIIVHTLWDSRQNPDSLKIK